MTAPQLSKQMAGRLGPANLALLPLDEEAIRRLAQNLSAQKLRQGRMTAIATISALLERLLQEIERVVGLTTVADHSSSRDLIKSLAMMRETADRLSESLGDPLN